MTVRELIEKLQKVNPNLVVISPKDDEGNSYRWPDCVDDDTYVLENELGEWGIEDIFDEESLSEEGMDKRDLVQVCYIG